MDPMDNDAPTPLTDGDLAEHHAIPVIGIGVGPGGQAALLTCVTQLPPESDMAFVVLAPGLSTDTAPLLPALAAQTRMPVIPVTTAVPIAPNQIYLSTAPDPCVVVDGHLALTHEPPTDGIAMPIDQGLRALAAAFGDASAVMLLAGAGSDGVNGLTRIKEAGGVTLVQDPTTADPAALPRAALATGLVDFVGPPADLPAMLLGYWRRGQRLPAISAAAPADVAPPQVFAEVFAILRTRTEHDFSQYKRPTIERRLRRRMQVTDTADLAAYAALLRVRPAEVQALFQDLLISVTNFFRDHAAWQALAAVVPQLFARTQPQGQVRVWVTACATGEEAYTVAILLREYATTLEHPPKIQVFATDIDDDAITVARRGIYPSTIAGDIRPDRLQQWFVADQAGYRVTQAIRDMVLFARHNVLHDPPFSQVDLITCRNLLIYLNREAQQQVIQAFHFSLTPGGILVLGTSESLDGMRTLFTPIDKAVRVFQRMPGAPLRLPMTSPPSVRTVPAVPPAPLADGAPAVDSFEALHQQLLSAYTLPSVIVNPEGEIIHLGRGMGAFLHFGEGPLSSTLLTVVHPDLRRDLRSAMFTAQQHGVRTEVPGVRAQIGDVVRLIDLLVQPILAPAWASGHLLIVFHDVGEAALRGAATGTSSDTLVAQVEAELEYTRGQLRTSTEQYEAAVEEFKAANEELQAINEELRAASEELVTSKEELQSVNEELTTLNQELQHKVEAVSQANNDLQNMITATQIATIFLDRQLRITRFTPSAQTLFNLIPSDLARPLAHVTHDLVYDQIPDDARAVLTTLTPRTREVGTRSGAWYLLRVLPYRTLDDRIAGVVITLLDITDRKTTEAALQASEAALQTAHDALEVRVEERTVSLVAANRSLQAEVGQRMRAEQARQDVIRQLVTVQEDERRRLARELHDQLGQQLTALTLGLTTLEPALTEPGPAELLAQLHGLVTSIGRKTHDLALDLRPTILDDLGLVAALDSYGEQWQRRTGIGVALHARGMADVRVDSVIETTIYRVVQEAFTNVLKHAQATQVSVVLHHAPTEIRVIVEDNGRGFDADAPMPHDARPRLGLLGLRERVALVGGTVQLESTIGAGTALYVQIPLRSGPGEDSHDTPSDLGR